MEIVKNDKKEQRIVYDPNKKYTWSAQDNFTLSGEKFGMILNTFRAILQTPEATRILMVERANEIVETIMKNAVEQGIIKEIQE
jgi:hypothetical protein